MLIIAHAGHWIVSLLYLLPFAIVALWLVRDRVRHGGEGPPRDPGDER